MNCSVAVRDQHRRLIDSLDSFEPVVGADLVASDSNPAGYWSTEITIDSQWASVPAHVLAEIADHNLGISDVSPQGRPQHLEVMVR